MYLECDHGYRKVYMWLMIDSETNLKVFIAADLLNFFTGEKEKFDFYIKIQNLIS